MVNMQPNEQKQYSQNNQPTPGGYVSPTGANIPEYLKMESVEPVSKRKFNKIIVALLFIILATLSALAVFAYIKWSESVQVEKFYSAVDGMLSKKYIHQKYSLAADGKVYRSSESYTDFTQIDKLSTKSKYSFITQSEDGDELTYKGEVIVKGLSAYVLIDESSTVKFHPNINKGVWYQTSSVVPSQKLSSTGIKDTAANINVPFGPIIKGDFSQDVSKAIKSFVRNQNVYKIVSHSSDHIDGKKMTLYTVEYTTEAINKLNRKLAELTGVELPYTYKYSDGSSSQVRKIRVWVDDSSNIVRLVQEDEDNDDKTVALEMIDYFYPNEIAITLPDDNSLTVMEAE